MNFDKEANSDKKNGGKGGGVGALKPKQYARLCQMRYIQKKYNYPHDVENVVQSTLQNTLITF